MWHISMYQKHIEFFKKHLKFFMGLETLSIVSCPLGDIPPRDFSIMTLTTTDIGNCYNDTCDHDLKMGI